MHFKRYSFALLLPVIVFLAGLTAEAVPTLRGSASHTVAAPAVVNEPGVVGLDLEVKPGRLPLIVKVFPGTPAQRAKLSAGDLILAVNGSPVQNLSAGELDLAISDQPGATVQFTVLRNGKRLSTSLQVAALSDITLRQTQSLFRGTP